MRKWIAPIALALAAFIPSQSADSAVQFPVLLEVDVVWDQFGPGFPINFGLWLNQNGTFDNTTGTVGDWRYFPGQQKLEIDYWSGTTMYTGWRTGGFCLSGDAVSDIGAGTWDGCAMP